MEISISTVKQLFEKQRKELNQSLQYASYIQQALLPKEGTLKRYFPEHFLLYIPRDIVSGDFYWVSKKENLLYLAIADCTGHGVPGAFLSILGISFLNQIVDRHECLTAASVLNTLREYIMRSLHQTGEESEQKDGIDMGFCIIDKERNTLQYAGAFNPLYIIKNSNQLIEIPGDKMPIGVAPFEEKSFQNHTFGLDDGDLVYLFSDGYVDQFGGPEGKKFKYRPFRNLLLNSSKLPIQHQKEKLKKSLEDWRGKLSQLDDVLLFGFRYH